LNSFLSIRYPEAPNPPKPSAPKLHRGFQLNPLVAVVAIVAVPAFPVANGKARAYFEDPVGFVEGGFFFRRCILLHWRFLGIHAGVGG